MPLRIVTINIPDVYIHGISELVDLGIYTSRSETIRKAVHLFIKNENMKKNSAYTLKVIEVSNR